jgi:hypothetical protein
LIEFVEFVGLIEFVEFVGLIELLGLIEFVEFVGLIELIELGRNSFHYRMIPQSAIRNPQSKFSGYSSMDKRI